MTPEPEREAFPDEIRTHTALHVLKGAVVRILGEGSLWTASTYVSGRHGRLTVTCPEKPSDEQIRRFRRIYASRLKPC